MADEDVRALGLIKLAELELWEATLAIDEATQKRAIARRAKALEYIVCALIQLGAK